MIRGQRGLRVLFLEDGLRLNNARRQTDFGEIAGLVDPASLESLMVNFSDTSLGDPDPPGWVELMLGTHPTLADRVAMARAWQRATSPD